MKKVLILIFVCIKAMKPIVSAPVGKKILPDEDDYLPFPLMDTHNELEHSIKEVEGRGNIVDEIIKLIDSMIAPRHERTTQMSQYFAGRRSSDVSIRDFVNHICNVETISDSCLVLAVIYLDMFCTPSLNTSGARNQITIFNSHRLIAVSVFVAVKFLEDRVFEASIYAGVFGLSLEELNSMEVAFLTEIKFSLFVPDKLFFKYKRAIMN
jgi:hypothetical protein